MDVSAPKGHPRLGWGPHLGAVEPPLRLLGTHPGSILPLVRGFCDPRGAVGSSRGTWEQWDTLGQLGPPGEAETLGGQWGTPRDSGDHQGQHPPRSPQNPGITMIP